MSVDVEARREPLLITFPPPAAPVSANQVIRAHGQVAAGLMRPWRDAAYWHWCAEHAGVGPSGRRYPPAIVQATIPFRTAQRRDPHNYVITVKAIVDGLVAAGAWPDDTPEFVTVREPILTIAARGIVTVALRPMSGVE